LPAATITGLVATCVTGERRQVERVIGVQRLRDQRACRHEQQRVAVGQCAGEFGQGRDEVFAGAVPDIDGGAQALAHLLRHVARHHVGCVTSKPSGARVPYP
jgi:hypothetical protein